MANGTRPSGQSVEPALVYDAGERRTHAEHAAEAYDFAQRADALQAMAENIRPDSLSETLRVTYVATAARAATRAQWHATMAVYEALRAGIVTRTTA